MVLFSGALHGGYRAKLRYKAELFDSAKTRKKPFYCNERIFSKPERDS